MFVYKALHNQAPEFIKDMLVPFQSQHHLCSSQNIKSNQITFIVTSPQHKCLGEWNSWECAPDSAKNNNNNLHMDRQCKKTTNNLHMDRQCKKTTNNLHMDRQCKKTTNNLHMDRQCKKTTNNLHMDRQCKTNNKQFTYGQTVQKNNNNNLHMDRQCKKTTNNLHMDRQCKKAALEHLQCSRQCKKNNNNLHMDSTYLQTIQKTMCKIHIHILSTHSVL